MSTQTSSQTFKATDDLQLRAEIDRSVKWPVLFFFTSAGFWLLAAIVLGFVSSLKLVWPTLFENVAFFQYPHLHAVHMNAFVYGWGFNVGIGVAIWLLARLTRCPLVGGMTIFVAGHIWNIAITLGMVAVLAGNGTGMEWLEFPIWIWPVLGVSYLLIAGPMMVMFLRRVREHTFISVWYLIVALLCFPWLLLSAVAYLFYGEGSAVIATAVNYWFISGMIHLFLVPIGLAATYYFIPKIIGKPVHSYSMAMLGFWGYIVIAAWAGMQRMMGGPLPVWMPAVSGAAVILLLIPAIVIFRNHSQTMRGHEKLLTYSPTLRFTFAGILGFLVLTITGAVLALMQINKLTGLSLAVPGYQHLAIYGFFSMAMFGAIAFITPRLVNCEWPSGSMLRFQFWFSIYGAIALVSMGIFGGMWQGHTINTPAAGWNLVLDSVHPYNAGRALAWVFLLFSNLVFVYNLWMMVFRQGPPAGKPTLIHQHEDENAAAGAH